MKKSPFRLTVRETVRALRHRNYRLFFIGQSISLVGTWMTQVAAAWLVYRLTGSVFLLGIVGFASQIPAFLLSPVAGVLSDSRDRHRIFLASQAAAMLHALALAFLALSGLITIGQVIALSVLQGIITAFDIPARQALVVDLVKDKKDLGNAIALNSSIFNAARLLGPPVAGLVIALGGEGFCFLVDGLSYIAVIAMLMMMRDLPRPVRGRGRLIRDLVQGVQYANRSVPIRMILTFVALISFVGIPYTVLMPAFVKEVLGGDAHIFGALMGATGFGAFAGSVYLASRRTVRGLIRLTAICGAAFGTGLIAFALSKDPWMLFAALFTVGFTMIVLVAGSNTVLQTIVDDDKRGRVMSLFTTAFMGMAPWGSLAAGALAARIGLVRTLVLEGVLCVAGAAFLGSALPRIRAVIRPIYMRIGIIPEVAPIQAPPPGR